MSFDSAGSAASSMPCQALNEDSAAPSKARMRINFQEVMIGDWALIIDDDAESLGDWEFAKPASLPMQAEEEEIIAGRGTLKPGSDREQEMKDIRVQEDGGTMKTHTIGERWILNLLMFLLHAVISGAYVKTTTSGKIAR